MNAQYEIYDDPFKMLILLATIVAEQQGRELDYENVGPFENDKFSLTNGGSCTRRIRSRSPGTGSWGAISSATRI